jgi:hypothetical protein
VDDGVDGCGEDDLDARQASVLVLRAQSVSAESKNDECWVRMARVCIKVGIGVEIEVGAAALSP